MEARIAEKDATIRELTQKLTELVQKEQEISQNAIAALQQRNYIEEHKNILEAEKQGSVVDVLYNPDNNGEQQHKKGLLSLFSRKKRWQVLTTTENIVLDKCCQVCYNTYRARVC